MDLSVFKDPALAKGLIHSIDSWAPEQATLMEVCGTHTVAIARNGLRDLMPNDTKLVSGPGCPVCVTSNEDIDTVIALARIPNVMIATFGDMTRGFYLKPPQGTGRRSLDQHRLFAARCAQACSRAPR